MNATYIQEKWSLHKWTQKRPKRMYLLQKVLACAAWHRTWKKVFFVSTPHPHFLVGSNYFLDL